MSDEIRKSTSRLVVGNWKMNGSLALNQTLLAGLLEKTKATPEKYATVQLAVCPSFPYLAQVQQALSGSSISWGAQDISLYTEGAYTGEVSVGMLMDFACQWAIVGHSERRSYHGETSQQVAEKARLALSQGMTPIVCIGESLEQRQEGNTLAIIEQQLKPVLALGEQLKNIVVAYEPVWAIGTGLTATPEQAQEVHAFIRELLRQQQAPQVQILYGGSVKSANAASLFAMQDIDGALVGGAALDADEFLAIAIA
ncbi:triosephosphate isomerase [Pelistega indica]|uniref:Triosephosphate isomerase n=1 Tax=Pelistega indica TaxID=1414851 RepID=V8FYU2_9BURK|nr:MULTISPECIES: triose-phosphate isomerase [Pelistega]ETD69340.1 triosephosphate isomerase [Pelistega indica]